MESPKSMAKKVVLYLERRHGFTASTHDVQHVANQLTSLVVGRTSSSEETVKESKPVEAVMADETVNREDIIDQESPE